MSYKVITPASAEPVLLADARLQVRLGATDPTDEDSLLTAWITAAREYAEQYTGRPLGVQTLEMALDAFPGTADAIVLDMPPVASITSLKYTDINGIEQTLDPTTYALSAYGDSRKVAPTGVNVWPVTQAVPDAVRIRYVAGTAACPQAARAAILLMVAHLFENRQEVVVDNRMVAAQIPMGAKALLDTITIYSW